MRISDWSSDVCSSDLWADLNAAGMVSGHAYGKALRTVKTCVGSEWCRFGTQDSTGLGIKIEQMSWGSWMPHKFKIAVSGCPRNCAEARSEEHTSELQSLMRISYAVFCLKKKTQ